MGVYNTYGDLFNVQLKVASKLTMKHFSIGDKVDIPDGIYIDYGGAITVKDGILIAEVEEVFNKWGGPLDTYGMLDHDNPLSPCNL